MGRNWWAARNFFEKRVEDGFLVDIIRIKYIKYAASRIWRES